MKRVCRYWGVLFWAVSATSLAQESLFSVQVQVDKTTLTVGDRFDYTLTLTYSPEFVIDSLDLKDKLAQFEIINSVSSVQTTKKQAVKKIGLSLVAWQTGEYEIPALAISYRDKEEKQDTVFSDPIKIEVKSVLTEASDTTDIKGLKPQIELSRSLWFYLIAGLFVLAVAALLFYLWKRKEKPSLKPEIVKPAWELAAQELHLLQNLLRQGKIQVKEYYFRLSEILRGYLERRFGIPLLERTTEEISRELEKDFLHPESKTPFLLFLHQSDLIKFAKSVPQAQQIDLDWQLAYQIVEETIPRPKVSETREVVRA